MTKNEFRDYCMLQFAIPAIKKVRERLSERYDIKSVFHYKYKDLCEEACQMLSTRINTLLILEKDKSGRYIRSESECIRGEQRHLPIIQTKYWTLEHMWLKVTFFDMVNDIQSVLYLDPTCEQFDEYYVDIPEFYVSSKPPKWFYPDDRNFAYGIGITKAINDHIRFNVRYKGAISNMGIIEIFQYKIWGKISQFIWEITPRYRLIHI